MKLDQLKTLDLHIPPIAGAFPHVKTVALTSSKPNHSIENLSITNAQLHLGFESFKNIDLLKNLQNLKVLDISGICIDTLEGLSPTIEKINIPVRHDERTQIFNILKSLPNLKEIK